VATLLTDIFVTVKDRYALATRSILSLLQNTPREQFRLTVCIDGSLKNEDAAEFFDLAQVKADYVLLSHENEGLGPTINRAVGHICSINEWYEHSTHGDQSYVAPFITMCQDDLLYSPNWLQALVTGFMAFEKTEKLGFASGVECVEHAVRKQLTRSHITKDWVRAAQMMGRREYWKSMMPIPRFDPETGRVRAKPNDGMGSGVDWWLIRNHENSVCKTGRTNLVMPGLIVHAGYDQSTWLQNGREMPESESDKDRVKNG
jgi:hypothetical protein